MDARRSIERLPLRGPALWTRAVLSRGHRYAARRYERPPFYREVTATQPGVMNARRSIERSPLRGPAL